MAIGKWFCNQRDNKKIKEKKEKFFFSHRSSTMQRYIKLLLEEIAICASVSGTRDSGVWDCKGGEIELTNFLLVLATQTKSISTLEECFHHLLFLRLYNIFACFCFEQ